jgi:Outer membrane protein beta-barrel domain
MRSFWFVLVVFLVFSPAVLGQGTNDYHRLDIAAGYVYAKQEPNSGEQFVTEGSDHFNFVPCTPEGADILGQNLQRVFCQRRGFNGFDASVTYNFKKHLGITGDVMGLYKPDTTVDDFGEHVDTNKLKDRTWEFLGGLQFKNNDTTTRFKPFVHVLAGLARQTSHDVQTSTGPFNYHLDDSVTSFAMKIGAGADLRVGKRIDLRLFEFNYNPIFAGDRHVPGNADFDLSVAGKRADNITFGVGIVFH